MHLGPIMDPLFHKSGVWPFSLFWQASRWSWCVLDDENHWSKAIAIPFIQAPKPAVWKIIYFFSTIAKFIGHQVSLNYLNFSFHLLSIPMFTVAINAQTDFCNSFLISSNSFFMEPWLQEFFFILIIYFLYKKFFPALLSIIGQTPNSLAKCKQLFMTSWITKLYLPPFLTSFFPAVDPLLQTSLLAVLVPPRLCIK